MNLTALFVAALGKPVIEWLVRAILALLALILFFIVIGRVLVVGPWTIAIRPSSPPAMQQIKTGQLALKFPSSPDNPSLSGHVRFDTAFTKEPKVSVHLSRLNQGIDPKRNLSFGITATSMSAEGFDYTANASYPAAVANAEWIAVGE
jgi:hypothetical protein